MVHPTCVSIATLRSQRQYGDSNNKKDVTNSLSSCPSIKLLSKRDQPLKPTGEASLKYFPKVTDFGDIIAFLAKQSYLQEPKTESPEVKPVPKERKSIQLERLGTKVPMEKERFCEQGRFRKTKDNSSCSRVMDIDNKESEKKLGKESSGEEEVKTIELKTPELKPAGVIPPPFKFTDLLDKTRSRRPPRYQNKTTVARQTGSPGKNQEPVKEQKTPPPKKQYPKPIMIETSFLDNSPYIQDQEKREKEKLPFDDDKDGPLIIPLDSEKAKLFESYNTFTPQVPFIPPPPLWSMVGHQRISQILIAPPSYSPPSSPPPFYQPPSPEYSSLPPPVEEEFDTSAPRHRSNTLTYLHEVKDYLSMSQKRNQLKQKCKLNYLHDVSDFSSAFLDSHLHDMWCMLKAHFLNSGKQNNEKLNPNGEHGKTINR